MDDRQFDEIVRIRLKPNVILNMSRMVPSLATQFCRNPQKAFRKGKGKALETADAANLTCIVILVAVVADTLSSICTRKRKHLRTQSGFTSSSDRPSNLSVAIASFMSQITRPTSILRAVIIAELYGIAGSKFVPANCGLVYTIFVLLLLEFRTKAPGAHTIAQFVGQPFSVVAHILTIKVSLLTSFYIRTINITDGSMVLLAVIRNVSKKATVLIVLILVGVMLVVARRGSYSFILYITITTVVLICAFLVFIVLNVPTYVPLGNVNSLYKLLMCYNRSNIGTGESVTDGFNDRILKDSLISLAHHVVQVLLDQALWETSIKFPPNHGVLGLLLANFMAFSIPSALGVVCGLGFRALKSSFFNAALLNKTQSTWYAFNFSGQQDSDRMANVLQKSNTLYLLADLVIFATPIHLLGRSGIWVIFIAILLLLVTSCMFSIVGASSVLYYDILATYIRPFKKKVDRATCLLCGKRRGHLASLRNICSCRSTLE
ncbi:unnamed protein product [Taenia asiatica]|uniref:Solute carrier family 40 protein n=1 Tax=Taenia asiatica TaxID=60517 RepID=A0A0R3VUE6_TAEAS|nr:unnamed protein product [Taenia asiatica]